jgi:hypothetical protein
MLVSIEVDAVSEDVAPCARCAWRITNVKENMSSSSLLSLTRKFGTAEGLEVSGSCDGLGEPQTKVSELAQST